MCKTFIFSRIFNLYLLKLENSLHFNSAQVINVIIIVFKLITRISVCNILQSVVQNTISSTHTPVLHLNTYMGHLPFNFGFLQQAAKKTRLSVRDKKYTVH